MKKRILLIGNGAREHVIAETLKRSKHEVELFAFGKAKNPGIDVLATDYNIGNYMNHDEVINYALEINPDFIVIGPDDPIGSGLADSLLTHGFYSMAPLESVAKLETSKSFTRDLINNHKITGNPKFKVFTSENGIKEFMQELGGQFVVKYDGLNGGKGVKVVGDHLDGIDDGYKYAMECINECGRVVVEEKLIGQEFSLLSFCDGVTAVHMPIVQDHKRAYDGDKGPNTGGMGTYSDANHSLPFLNQEDVKTAKKMNESVLEALRTEVGIEYKGIMYGGFIAVKNGVKIIEYNARFGDPEAMNILPILKTDFVDICEAIINGTLASLKIEFENKATVCKYIVPNGYPTDPVKGEKIEIGDVPANVKMYYGSVDKKEDGLYLSSSRAIAFVGIDDSIEGAQRAAAQAVNTVKGPVFYRNDIGTAKVINSKINLLNEIRK